MELQMKPNSSILLRIAFLVIGKGKRLISKATKRMHTILIKSFHRDSRRQSSFGSSSLVEYEFSCNNTPDILFYHKPKSSSFRFFFFFFFSSCLSDVVPEALEEALRRHDDRRRVIDNLEGDNYYTHQLWENEKGSGVDDAAEEFIKRFYEQLKGETDQSLHAAACDSDD